MCRCCFEKVPVVFFENSKKFVLAKLVGGNSQFFLENFTPRTFGISFLPILTSIAYISKKWAPLGLYLEGCMKWN